MAANVAERLSLSRKQRIKQGRDFSRLRRKGRRLTYGWLTINWQPLATETTSRVGVIVGGKLGNAVVRSRIKRLLREAFRQHQHKLSQAIDLVLVAQAPIVGKTFAEVERDFLMAIGKAGLLKGS